MAISTRGSALAIKKETTEGTPVPPAADADFVALQDFAITPSFNLLENAERLNSLASAAPSLGIEEPAVALSHYWRGSGVEGQAPNYGELLEAAFGTETVQSTERTTTAGSTTTVVELAAGGSDYALGRPLLLKDPTNGRSVRFVTSVASDSLTLGFALDNAPATGVNCGKHVVYEPANSGHPSLTFWHYIGDQADGALEMVAGGRTTSLSVSAPAGEFINVTYGCEGISYSLDPITIGATNKFLDFTSDNGTFAVSIEEKTYKDPKDVAEALQAAMSDADPAETFSVSYSGGAAADGKYTISTSTSTVLSLLWNTGANAANTIGATLGYSTAADDTGATSYEADNAQDWSTSTLTPTFDSAEPLVAKSNEVFIGDQADNVCFEASEVTITMDTPKTNIESVCAESGVSGSIINARAVTVEITALLEEYRVEEFHRFQKNQTTRFQYTGGEKTGGNWIEGKTVAAYGHTMKISDYSITSEENLATVNFTLTGFATGPSGEFFMAQL